MLRVPVIGMDENDPCIPKPSDQLPEEAPAGQVPDDRPDAPEGGARESAKRQINKHAGDRKHRAREGKRAGQPTRTRRS